MGPYNDLKSILKKQYNCDDRIYGEKRFEWMTYDSSNTDVWSVWRAKYLRHVVCLIGRRLLGIFIKPGVSHGKHYCRPQLIIILEPIGPNQSSN